MEEEEFEYMPEDVIGGMWLSTFRSINRFLAETWTLGYVYPLHITVVSQNGSMIHFRLKSPHKVKSGGFDVYDVEDLASYASPKDRMGDDDSQKYGIVVDSTDRLMHLEFYPPEDEEG